MVMTPEDIEKYLPQKKQVDKTKKRLLGTGTIPPVKEKDKRRKQSEALRKRKKDKGINCLWTKKGSNAVVSFEIIDDEWIMTGD